MARYGQSVILTRRETGASLAVRAFVQPVRRQREDLPVAATPLGAVSRQRWLYIGPPEPAPARREPAPAPRAGKALQVVLNGRTLELPGKAEGGPDYVMDLLEQSEVDFEHLDRGVELKVNGAECAFTQELRPQDDVVIRYLEQ